MKRFAAILLMLPLISTAQLRNTGSTFYKPDQSNPSHKEGVVFYDQTEKALSYYNDNSSVTVNIGQEQLMRVRNTTGSTIINGSLVYISGANSGLPTVALADADAENTAVVAGMATHDIANSTNGYIAVQGIVHGLNTNAFVAGDLLYLSGTAGAFTTTAPSSPSFVTPIGVVTAVSSSVGTVQLRTTRQFVGNGTANFVYAMNSAGTARTWAANTGGWTTLRVSGSNATTTGQSLVDITGLVTGALSNATLYEVEAVLYVTTSAVTTGCQYGFTANGTGGAATVFIANYGTNATNTITTASQSTSGTAQGTFLTTSGSSGIVVMRGYILTRGSGTATIALQHLKVTSGTSTVNIGSVFRYRLAS